jgi:hypothetical protein
VMSITKGLFRVKLCRTRSGTILGTSTLVLWSLILSLALTLSGCMGSPESGGTIQFQTYSDNPYYNTPPQTPGWLQLQAPASVTVGQNFSMEVLARDAFSNPYLLPVNVTLSIINTTTATVVSPPPALSTFNGLSLYAPFALNQVGTYTVSATALGFTPYTSTVTALPGPPVKLAFTGANPGQINTSSCTQVSVSVEDAGGNVTTTPAALNVSITAGNNSTLFSESTCSTAYSGESTVPAAGSSASVWVWDDSPDLFNMTASATSLTSGTISVSTVGKTIFTLGGQNGSFLSSIAGSVDGGVTWNSLNPVNSSLHFQLNAFGNAVVFNHLIYYFGGNNGSALNTIYSSSNGTDWTLLTAQMPVALYQGAVVVFEHKIWYLGGYSNSNVPTNTVFSFDGTTVQNLTSTAGFPFIAAEAAFAMGNVITAGTPKIVIVGGTNSSTITGQNYSTTNPSLADNWLLGGSSIASSLNGLTDMGYAIFNNLLYMVGGNQATGPNSTVFTSSTGASPWTQGTTITHTSDFPMVVHSTSAGTLQLSALGGELSTGVYTNDTFNTTDGVNWVTDANALPVNAANSAAVVFTPGL